MPLSKPPVVPGFAWTSTHALEVSDEDILQPGPASYLSVWEVLEPCPGRLCQVQREVAYDDLVGGAARPASEPEVVELDRWVYLSVVLVDVRGTVEPWGNRCGMDFVGEGSGAQAVRVGAWAPVLLGIAIILMPPMKDAWGTILGLF